MTANVLNALASVLLDENRPADAEPMFREALASLQQTATPEQWKLAIVRVGMGRTYAVLGRFSEAEAELLEAERLLLSAKAAPPDITGARCKHWSIYMPLGIKPIRGPAMPLKRSSGAQS
jgi:hypothetical protein